MLYFGKTKTELRRQFANFYGSPNTAYFGHITTNGHIYSDTCKEVFVARIFDNENKIDNFIYIYYSDNDPVKAMAKINKLEEQIGISKSTFEIQKLTFKSRYGIQICNVTMIKVNFAREWRSNRVSMSILLEYLRSLTINKRNVISKLLTLLKKEKFLNYFKETKKYTEYESSYGEYKWINKYLCSMFLSDISGEGAPLTNAARIFVKDSFSRKGKRLKECVAA